MTRAIAIIFACLCLSASARAQSNWTPPAVSSPYLSNGVEYISVNVPHVPVNTQNVYSLTNATPLVIIVNWVSGSGYTNLVKTETLNAIVEYGGEPAMTFGAIVTVVPSLGRAVAVNLATNTQAQGVIPGK